MRLILIPLLFFSLLFISAKDGCNSNKIRNPIYGNWVWAKTFCCGRNSVWSDPNTCGYSQNLEINPDGTYRLHRTNDKVQKGKYTIRKGLNDFQLQQGDTSLVIQMGEDPPSYIHFIGDTLVLSRGYMDYDNVYYVREIVIIKNK